MFCKNLARFLHIPALAVKIVGDRAGEPRMGDEMPRMGGDGHIAPRELVFALGTGLDPLQALGDREVDRLVVADFEMQERMVLNAAQ